MLRVSGGPSSTKAIGIPCTSHRIREIVGRACAGNARKVFPATDFKRNRHALRHVRDARAVMHVGIANPWWRGKCLRHSRCMHNPKMLRICQEAHHEAVRWESLTLGIASHFTRYDRLSSTWCEFDPSTAYVVCISVSLGFPYMVSRSLGFPYMVMLQTFKRKRHWMRSYYGLLWTLHCSSGCYCDVTMRWPLLFHGTRADLSGIPINAVATRIHGDHGLWIDW